MSRLSRCVECNQQKNDPEDFADGLRCTTCVEKGLRVEPMPPPTKDLGYTVKLTKDSPGPVRVNFTTRDGALLEVVLKPGESVSFSP